MVSKGWLALYSASDLLKLRASEGVAEEYLVCFPGGNPSVCQGQLYYPLAGKWRRIPPTPVELHSYGLVRTRGPAIAWQWTGQDRGLWPCLFLGPSVSVIVGDSMASSKKPLPLGTFLSCCILALLYEQESFGVVASGQQIFVIGGVLFDARVSDTYRPWTS